MNLNKLRTCIVVASLAGTWCGAAHGAYRFETSDVLDLSTDERLVPLEKADPPAVTALAAADAKAILAAPEVGNDAPGQLTPLDGTDKAVRKQERARLAADSAAVQRSGRTLKIKTASGGSVDFTDRPPPAKADSDADGELFVYAGRVGANYFRVEERFQQDAPGSYLVSASSGKSVFVPNGSYEVQLSSDGKWLLSMSSGDTRALLVVMALDADGPHLALICHGGNTVNAGPAAFKGWHDDHSVDLVLSPLVTTPGKAGSGAAAVLPAASIPLRLAFDGQGWHPEAQDPKALERIGYTCRQ